MNELEAKHWLDRFHSLRILVLGDLMIDHYIWGQVHRISPEAPVPVVNVTKEEFRLGGAANVVHNCHSLGAEVFLVGLTGDDRFGGILRQRLEEAGVNASHLIEVSGRPTTLKTRVVAHSQQVVRIDFEQTREIPEAIENHVIECVCRLLPDVDALLIEDYNKGLLTARVISEVLSAASRQDVITTVDPKFRNFFAYKGVTVFKPNLSELEKNLGVSIETEDDLDKAAGSLLEEIQAANLVVTRGEKGLSIFRSGNSRIDIPTFAQEVYDVSGAGDTVISTLSLALAAGCEIGIAATIANHAAGMVCGKVGIHPVHPSDILQSIRYHSKG